jgi:hypothetical protein
VSLPFLFVVCGAKISLLFWYAAYFADLIAAAVHLAKSD